MNFLAHLHIASHTQSSFIGSFLGDFVKGNPQGRYHDDIVKGIRLHRFVDMTIDDYYLEHSLKRIFPRELRRYAPIALDMFWDHALAKHWTDYHTSSLIDFCLQAQLQMELECLAETTPLPKSYYEVSERLWQKKWFEYYVDIDNISFALQRMAARSPRMTLLANTGLILKENYEQLSGCFFESYPEILMKTIKFMGGK